MNGELSPEQNYEVGYGRLPKDRQFRPGQSGTPNGWRKKQGMSIPKVIGGALSERVSVTMNAKPDAPERVHADSVCNEKRDFG